MSRGSDAPRANVLPLVTTDDVVARLEALLAATDQAPSETLLAFDADGTLWSGDVGIDNFEALLERGAILPAAAATLRDEAAASGLPVAETPTAQARVLYDAYLRGAYSEERAFRMMACAFAGYREEEVRTFAAGVAHTTRLRDRMHAEILPIVAWASRRGVLRYVVSASHAVVVASSIEQMGLGMDGLFAMSQAERDSRFLPSIVEPATYGAGKTAALFAGVRAKLLLGAFGDSAFDLHLLREARLAVAVRPKPELRARATECAGLVELAQARE
jgi:phosphatidylglycerophosphatase C